MSPPTRQSIFAAASRKLRADFQELQNIPHRGEKGTEAEVLVRRFLKEHLPRRFAVGSGFIIDQLENVSPQTDVLVYDAFNCPVYRASESAGIFPSNNVAAVIEVKSRLDKRAIEDAAAKTLAVKKLAKHKGPGPSMAQTLGCLFAFESDITLEKAAQHCARLVRENGLGGHLDLVLILDIGVLSIFVQLPGEPVWNRMLFYEGGGEHGRGAVFGYGQEALGKDSLDEFLRRLLVCLSLFRGMVDLRMEFGSPASKKLPLAIIGSIETASGEEKSRERRSNEGGDETQ